MTSIETIWGLLIIAIIIIGLTVMDKKLITIVGFLSMIFGFLGINFFGMNNLYSGIILSGFILILIYGKRIL